MSNAGPWRLAEGGRHWGAVLAAAAVPLLTGIAPAAAQSLALTYALGESGPVPARAGVAIPCLGPGWQMSPEGCRRELRARFTALLPGALPAEKGMPPLEPETAPVPGEAAATGELRVQPAWRPAPTLPGLPIAAEPGPQAAGASGSRGGAGELVFRVGNSLRAFEREEAGAGGSRFTDLRYEAHRQSKGHKALGVELFVPFH